MYKRNFPMLSAAGVLCIDCSNGVYKFLFLSGNKNQKSFFLQFSTNENIQFRPEIPLLYTKLGGIINVV